MEMKSDGIENINV